MNLLDSNGYRNPFIHTYVLVHVVSNELYKYDFLSLVSTKAKTQTHTHSHKHINYFNQNSHIEL